MSNHQLNFALGFCICTFCICFSSGCKLYGKLEKVQLVKTKVPEASGLTLRDGYLYAVSDANGDIYQLDLQGKTIEIFKTKTKDVEGITAYDEFFILVDEAKQKLYTYTLDGDRLEGHQLSHPKIYNPSSGLEGITYDKYTNSFYVINEKESGQLLEYKTDFTFIKQNFLGSYSDYSGIATTKDHIWVISDEAKGMAQYDRDLNLLKLYDVLIDSPEGIAIDEVNGLIYVISDTTSELVVFKLPKAN